MKNFIIFILLIISAYNAGEQSKNQSSDSNTTTPEKDVHFLWHENKYDIELKDTVNTIIINEAFCKNITDAQKAALGFVGTFVGSECWWDGEARNDRSNLQCKILTALNLGYQCSEQHLGFLRQWFKTDEKALERLNDIKISTKGDKIKVWYAASGVNLREEQAWDWTEKITFQVNGNNLSIIEQKSSRK